MAQRRMSRVAAKAEGVSKAHQQSNDFFLPETNSSPPERETSIPNHPFLGANC